MKNIEAKLSIITPTYNSAIRLAGLVDSLRSQSDKNFEWVVVDGASRDSTLEMLGQIYDIKLVIDSRPDFGIYDAINRGIQISNGNYYVVVGDDDLLYNNAVSVLRGIILKDNYDIISAGVIYNGKVLCKKKSPSWLSGQASYISAHSVATVFNKNLHSIHGYYSKHFPIAADQLFVMSAIEAGCSNFVSDEVVGELGSSGVSSVDRFGNATEVFRVQIVMGRSFIIQFFLLIIRLLRINFVSFHSRFQVGLFKIWQN